MTEKINELPNSRDIIWGRLILANYIYNLSPESQAKEALGLEISKLWEKYQTLK